MKQTENLALNLPEGPDNYDVNDYNENFEIIDEKMKYLADHIGGGGTLGTLWANNNGEYNASEDPTLDAWDKVIVDVQPRLTGLLATANGVYKPEDFGPFDGFSTAVVDVSPTEVLESEWDLLHCNSTTGYHDLVKDVYLPTNRYRNFANGYLTDNGGFVTLAWCNYGDIKRYVVQMGQFDRSLEPQQQYLGLFSFVYGTQGCIMYYDNNNSRWFVRDSGGTQYISDSEIPKYCVDGATIEVVLGARYIDGELYRGKKVDGAISESYHQRLTMYIHATDNQTYELKFDANIGADYPDYMCAWRIGSGGSAWLGALFENAKIYNVFNCYDKYFEAPKSLMMAAPGETEELRAEIEEEPEAEIKKEPEIDEIKQKEEKETEETNEAGLLKNEKSEEGQKSEAE